MAISTAVDVNAVARVVGIKTQFIPTNVGGVFYLPQRIAVVGQGATAATYPTTKRQVTSAQEAGTLYGFGSPIHLAVSQLLPPNGDGVGSIPVTVYPLEDADSSAAAAGDITASSTATKSGQIVINIGGVRTAPIGIATNDDAAAIHTKIIAAITGNLSMPMTATQGTGKVDLTAKWTGANTNQLTVTVEGDTDTGVTFAVTDPTGGTVNPDVQTALDQVGDVWETMFLNCMELADTDTLDKFDVFGEGRWGALTNRPMVAFTGHVLKTPTEVLAITDSRKADRTNVALPNPGSLELPLVSAAGELARIAKVANNNPARDYARQPASYIEPGPDGDQWDYLQRDQAVKGGASTIEIRDGKVNLSDTVTMYHPEGDPTPAYRYVCDIVKVMNIIFNVDLIFNTAAWDGAPLIPDDQPTVNPDAKRPKDALAALAALADNLGLEALISDVPHTKANAQSEISSQNPKRLDTVFPVKLSGNANIHSIDLNFGFYFGTSAVIA